MAAVGHNVMGAPAQAARKTGKGDKMSGPPATPVGPEASRPFSRGTSYHKDASRLNPCELESNLFDKGMRIDPSCPHEQDARSPHCFKATSEM